MSTQLPAFTFWKISALLTPLFLLFIFFQQTPHSGKKIPNPIYDHEKLNIKAQENQKELFTDITIAAGITITHIQHSEYLSGIHESLGSGACAFDYDNDGWIDLLTLNGSGTTHFFGKAKWWQGQKSSLTLYKNNTQNNFLDKTSQSGLITSSWTMGCTTGDFNNDGYSDIFISNYGKNQLWKNNGNGTFTEISKQAGIIGKEWSTGISLVDINQDGFLDIYVNNYIQFTTNSLTFESSSGYESKLPENFNASLYPGTANHFYINQGDFTFVEQAAKFGISNSEGRSLSSLWTDINNDKLPDLLIANDKGTENKVYLNQGNNSFTDISTQSRLGHTEKSSNITITDFNNDNNIDLFISTGNLQYPRIYTHTKNAISFNEVSQYYLLQDRVNTSNSHWNAITEDFNADGFTDIFIANGLLTSNPESPLIAKGQPNSLLLNASGKEFVDASASLSPNTYRPLPSRCALASDFDNNGSIDLYIAHNNDVGQLLKNTTEEKNWIGFDLKAHNRNAIGANVTLLSSGKTKGANESSFLCDGDKRIIFSINKEHQNNPVDILITWADGLEKKYSNLKAGHYHLITKENHKSKIITHTPKNYRSKIKFTKGQHKLSVINWLIENKQYSLANSELKLIFNSNDTKRRLDALKLSQQLPIKYRGYYTQQGIVDTDKNIKIQAIKNIKNSENELLFRWLAKELHNNDDDISCLAANTFGHFFDEEEAMIRHKYTAINPLIKLTESKSPRAQICAINVLGKSEKYRPLIPLLELANSTEPKVKQAAIEALGNLKEKGALPSLKKIFASHSESQELRIAAAASIKKIDTSDATSNYLSKHLSNTENSHLITTIASNPNTYALLTRELADLPLAHLNSSLPDNTEAGADQNTTKGTDNTTFCTDNSALSETEKVFILKNLNGCLTEAKLVQVMPEVITWGLAHKDITIRKAAYKILAPRKERWAREKIAEIIQSERYHFNLKTVVIEHLPEKIPAQIEGELIKLAKKYKHTAFSAVVTKHLLQRNHTEMQLFAQKQLKESINKGNEAHAFLFAEALIAHSPEKTLNNIIAQDQSL